jgi:hypothetical protein
MLTDDTGLLQHSKYLVPTRKEGYCTDDNARAVIVCTRYLNGQSSVAVERLLRTYLSFLLYMQREDGQMHNFLSYDRKFLDEIGSEDCMGHTIWACGTCLNSNLSEDLKRAAKEILDKILPWTTQFQSLRGKALSILGLHHYQKVYPHSNSRDEIRQMADQIVKQYQHEASKEWKWFEPKVTYANGRLPHALLLAYKDTAEQKYLQTATESLEFLFRVQMNDDVFAPVGNQGWYVKHSEKAVFDQQAIEASCMVEAAVAAYEATKKRQHLEDAEVVFGWFLGKNVKNVAVYDRHTGSCYDGITPEGVNLNRGAESLLAYLQACLTLRNTKLPNGKQTVSKTTSPNSNSSKKQLFH